jgi:hypothetical protein
VKALLVAAQVYLWGAVISFAVALLIQLIFVVIRAVAGGSNAPAGPAPEETE